MRVFSPPPLRVAEQRSAFPAPVGEGAPEVGVASQHPAVRIADGVIHPVRHAGIAAVRQGRFDIKPFLAASQPQLRRHRLRPLQQRQVVGLVGVVERGDVARHGAEQPQHEQWRQQPVHEVVAQGENVFFHGVVPCLPENQAGALSMM